MTYSKILPTLEETLFLLDMHDRLHGPSPFLREIFKSSRDLLEFWTNIARKAMNELECRVLKTVLCTNSPLDDPIVNMKRALMEANFNHPLYDHLVSQLFIREDMICRHYSHKYRHATLLRNQAAVCSLRKKKDYPCEHEELKFLHDIIPTNRQFEHYLLR